MILFHIVIPFKVIPQRAIWILQANLLDFRQYELSDEFNALYEREKR